MKSDCDVLVIGGGPAGCQAALGAVTEGLKVCLVEADEIGGQIRTTPRLENFLGYTYGTTGMSFAGTMREQIERLGVRIIRGRAQGIEPGAEMSVGLVRVLVGEDFSWYARSVVIATGSAPISAEVEGERIGPADAWNMDVEGHNVIVLGGGNSAGQVLLHLAERARTVYAVVRSGLKTSAYLTSRIQARHNVVVLQGGVSSERLPDGRYVISHADGLAYVNAKALFSCYGGIPASDWIGCVERDDSGRVLIGNHGYEYGTTQPGVFAIGDVRYGAVQRVPSAIGDGSNVQRDLWGYLNG